MKIAQINVVYPSGSTGKIVKKVHEALLLQGHDSRIYFGRGPKIANCRISKIAPEFIMMLQSFRSRITGLVYNGCIISTHRLIKQLKDFQPDIVHVHCINGYMVNIYKLLEYLKKHDIATVLTLHAEFMYTGGCSYTMDCNQWITECCKNGAKCPQYNKLRPTSWFFHRVNKEWNLMRKAFERFENLTVCPVSDWVLERAEQSAILRGKRFRTVMNGLDTSVFCPREYGHLVDKYKLHGDKVVLHVTPDFYSPIKGGNYVLEIAKHYIGEKIKFIVIGYSGNGLDLPGNVIPVSHIKDQSELAAYYSMADVTLLTSAKETFSMIVAESLCCGTPIVGFRAGAPESIALPHYSTFVEQGDVKSLINAIDKVLHEEKNVAGLISKEAQLIYAGELMTATYFSVYQEMYNE